MPISEELLEQIKNNDPELTSLSLHESNLNNEDIKALAQALKVNHTITYLYLGKNQIGDVGAAFLADMLEVNNTITNLTLYDNQIGNTGALSFAKALKVNHTIFYLNLNDNLIGDIGAIYLADALKVNDKLGALNLFISQIQNIGINALTGALESNYTILALLTPCILHNPPLATCIFHNPPLIDSAIKRNKNIPEKVATTLFDGYKKALLDKMEECLLDSNSSASLYKNITDIIKSYLPEPQQNLAIPPAFFKFYHLIKDRTRELNNLVD